MLLMLCPLKQVCSIPECVQLLRLTERQSGKTPQQNYDAFCASLESAVHSCFGQQEHAAPQGLILPCSDGGALLLGCAHCHSQIERSQQHDGHQRQQDGLEAAPPEWKFVLHEDLQKTRTQIFSLRARYMCN